MKLTRVQIINAFIKKNNYKSYLEIGVNTPAQPGFSHNKINVEIKHGVDPNVDTTYRMTSNSFFEQNSNTYDIIFIDGLHIFEQVYKDIINSLKFLNANGTIIVHDCNPKKEITQRRVRASSVWHGDVWKAILKLRTENPDVSIYTIDADHGCAIIQKGKQELLKINDDTIDIYNFDFFKKNKEVILNLISKNKFQKKLKIEYPNRLWQYFINKVTNNNSDKLQLKNVTLFAVACTKIPETIRALEKSKEGINFAEVILITHENISLDQLEIKVINIDKLDYKDYNHFILFRARNYIKTDYSLLVQNDGYVLRPQKWDDKFFNYDYIGAPWRKNIHFTKDGTNIRVGNGGFSFRSKKLLDSFVDLGLEFTDDGTGFWHEDGNISVYYRKALEEAGIKFAPVEIAAKFSHEDDIPESVFRPFGFHGSKIVFPTWLRGIKKILKKLKVRL